MNAPSIIVKNVSVTLQGNKLLQNISFELPAGEHLAIIGSSGSGKTTLAKVLAGQLFANGIVQINYDAHSPLQQKVKLVEQRYGFKNLSNTTDFYYQQRFNSFDAEDTSTVKEELYQCISQPSGYEIDTLLTELGLEHRKHAPLIQLSSGEHKRFQLIKALLSPSQVLVLDSPFTGLDKTARKQLQRIINRVAATGTKLIVITDAYELPQCITKIAHLKEGKLKDFAFKELFDFTGIEIHKTHHSFNIYELPLTVKEDNFKNTVLIKNATVNYGNKMVLYNINWQVRRGEKWLLRGHNGAGKSTLLSLINGDNPQAYKNEIYLFDKRRGTGESIWDIKRQIGYVSPELHAFFDKSTTAYNTIASGFFDTIGLFKKLSAAQQDTVQGWIRYFQIPDVQHKPFRSLSFGLQRLLLLGRALVKNPPLLILDEPCQGLDEEQKNNFVQLVNDLCEQLNKTLIYVSHYENEIPDCIDHIIELKNGEQNIYSVKRKELYSHKANNYEQHF